MSTTDSNITADPQPRAATLKPVENNVLSVGTRPLAGSPGSDSINSGLTCGSQVTVGPIRPVDRRTLEGSTPGDFRAQAAKPDMSFASNPPGPRDRHQQAELSSRTPAAPAPQVTDPGSEVGD